MTWDEELVLLLRTLIDDTSEDTPAYSDERLENALIVAARLVVGELDFTQDFTGSITETTITPDPCASATRDDNFINLVVVRAACIIDRGSAAKAAGQAIMVRDGTSQIDLREMFKAKLQLINKGWCAVYEDMKADYQLSQHGVVIGAAIVSPFRLFAGLETPYYTGGAFRR